MKNLTTKFLFIGLVMAGTLVWLSAGTNEQLPIPIEPMKSQQPEELGKVSWLRDLEVACSRSVNENKPILILFQEVPGCATCQRYGKYTLSHPLIVEAIETAFIPVAIYNNKKGEDARVLQYFNEPAWNNPVLRIVDAGKKDIVPRLAGDYSPLGLVNAMLTGLDASNRVAPRYLQLLGEELQARATGTESATLAMYCFWTGEKELGRLPGVVRTEAGFMAGREVVQVEYNPAVVSYETLLKDAQRVRCVSHVFAENDAQQKAADRVVGRTAVSGKKTYRPDRESKYYLFRSHWRYVPMTDLQAARANSLVGQGLSPEEVLSPRQLDLAGFIRQHPNAGWESAIGKGFFQAWERAVKKAGS